MTEQTAERAAERAKEIKARATLLAFFRAIAANRFLLFLSSNVAQRAGQLVLLVALVYFASPQDVYRFGLLSSFCTLIVPIFSMNLHMSIGRLYFDFPDTQERHDFSFAALVAGTMPVLVGTVLVIAAFWSWKDPLTVGSIYYRLALIPVTVAFVTCQYFYVLVRVTDRAEPFFWFGIIVGCGYAGLFLLLVALGVPGLVAAVAAYGGAQIAGAAYGWIVCSRILHNAHFHWRNVKLALPYSSGTVIYSIVQWCLNFSGRWIGSGYLTHSELATYTLVTQFYAVLTIFLTMIFETHRVDILSLFAVGQSGGGVAKLNRYSLQSLGVVAAIYAVLAMLLPFYGLLLPKSYLIGAPMVVLSALFSAGTVFSIRAYWISIGLKKTLSFGAVAVASALFAIGISYIAVPYWGVSALLGGAAAGVSVQALVASLLFRVHLRRAS